MALPSNGAEVWMERGIDAFRNNRFAETADNFEKAVAIEPQSANARLSLGVAYLVQYIPGGQSEENSAFATRAEESFLKSLQLDPRNKLGMGYLAALYFSEANAYPDKKSRFDDARQLYERILEIYPDYQFAYYACGAIDWWKARKSPRAEIGSLLDRSAQNLLRTLEMNPEDSNAMAYLSIVRRDQAALAVANDERLRLTREADEWDRKANQIRQTQTEATVRLARKLFPATSSSPSQGIYFEPIPEKPGEVRKPPPFPPEELSQIMIPPPPPPPPPPPVRR